MVTDSSKKMPFDLNLFWKALTTNKTFLFGKKIVCLMHFSQNGQLCNLLRSEMDFVVW